MEAGEHQGHATASCHLAGGAVRDDLEADGNTRPGGRVTVIMASDSNGHQDRSVCGISLSNPKGHAKRNLATRMALVRNSPDRPGLRSGPARRIRSEFLFRPERHTQVRRLGRAHAAIVGTVTSKLPPKEVR